MMQPPPPRDPKLRMGLTIGNAQPLTTPAWVARGPAVEDPHFPSRAKPSPRRGGASPTAETPAHTGEASPQLVSLANARPTAQTSLARASPVRLPSPAATPAAQMPPLAYSTHNPLPTHGRRPARRKQPSEEQWWRWDEPEDAPLAPIKKGPAAARAQAPLGREEPCACRCATGTRLTRDSTGCRASSGPARRCRRRRRASATCGARRRHRYRPRGAGAGRPRRSRRGASPR
ncbi:hypothetical protein M885DRAFT_192363 [Pelagophyceae sp. CCMP2097]|nr:hypothetical protein M885DRAFT_192363 [Pelagophyceae sp. CCMP2097]